MIAIPLDKSSSTTISDLYGNAPYFAILDTLTGSFNVVENKGCGNGLKTASYVNGLGVKGTIFYHMGEGVFKALYEGGIKVFSATKIYLSIEDIFSQILNDSCKLVTKENYKYLLYPGTQTCKCECNNS